MNKRPLSLAGLRGFLAAARHLSFTQAAQELHLTQSALSRQVQALETELGMPLFIRTTRHIALTSAGEALFRATMTGLQQIDQTVSRLRASRGRKQIVVTTFASCASLWLIPRLHGFSAGHPDVDVNCIATDRAVDLDAENVDVALRCTQFPVAAEDGDYLFPECVVPACSPGLLANGPAIATPADLARHTLLKNEEAVEMIFPWLAWESWFELQGCKPPTARSALRFTNHDQVVQAALSGQGVALARGALAAELIASGRLVLPLGTGAPSPFSYYVVTSRESRQRPEVQAFVAWIRKEAELARPMVTRLIDQKRALRETPPRRKTRTARSRREA